MILISKFLHPKLRTVLNLIHQKFKSILVNFKTPKNKTERSTLLIISCNPNKFYPNYLKTLKKKYPYIQFQRPVF